MTSVSNSVLRACFKTFLGEEDYRKFLDAGARDPLSYWQEKAWERFVSAHPSLAVSSYERAEAFEVCPVHERPLISGYTEPPFGYLLPRSSDWKLLFPRAPLMPLTPHGTKRVSYCTECVVAESKWLKSRLTNGEVRTFAPEKS